jgi:hypothetical protein
VRRSARALLGRCVVPVRLRDDAHTSHCRDAVAGIGDAADCDSRGREQRGRIGLCGPTPETPDFPSTHGTIAFSGGSRLRPTTWPTRRVVQGSGAGPGATHRATQGPAVPGGGAALACRGAGTPLRTRPRPSSGATPTAAGGPGHPRSHAMHGAADASRTRRKLPPATSEFGLCVTKHTPYRPHDCRSSRGAGRQPGQCLVSVVQPPQRGESRSRAPVRPRAASRTASTDQQGNSMTSRQVQG